MVSYLSVWDVGSLESASTNAVRWADAPPEKGLSMNLIRLLNKMYAVFFGFFWLPCPICREFFGGHEVDITCEPLYRTNEYGYVFYPSKVVCKNCKEKVKELNDKLLGEFRPLWW